MSKQELISEFKKLLSKMSYYNAAEGSWRQEYNERVKTKDELQKVAKELIDLNIDVDEIASGGYLVSKSDYIDMTK